LRNSLTSLVTDLRSPLHQNKLTKIKDRSPGSNSDTFPIHTSHPHMAGKSKMSGDELDDPSLLVPETPDQTHRTFINPEHRLRRLESMIDEYEDTQKAILQKLNLLTANIDVPPTPPRKASPNSRTNSESSGIISTIGHTIHTPAPRHERPKAAIPESFNGDRKKGRAFLTSCQLYMNLRRTEFTDEQDQIQWVLSYMKSGRAAIFTQRTLRKEF